MVKNNTLTILLAKEFEFTSKPEEVYPLLNKIISCISEKIPPGLTGIEGRCRLILTELFTNALKHSSMPKSMISVIIDEEKIQLIKSDQGRPFYLPAWKEREALQWPLKDYFGGEKIIIYEDQMCCLYGLIESSNKIDFYTKDLLVQIPPRPRDLLEHFGLMILTKSSDDFIYQYDPATETNLFRARIFF